MIVASSFWWYASRASGLVLWMLVAVSIMWGFAVSARLVRRRGLPAWMLDLHRHLGWLSCVFTAVHLIALWADSFVYFGPAELFVPMASDWKPGAVTWGVVALYLLVVIQVSSWFMKRLPRKVWHAIHLCSIPLLLTGTIHGITAGTDWGLLPVTGALLVAMTSIVWLATFRLLGGNKKSGGDDRLAAVRAARAAAARSESAGSAEAKVG